MFISTLSLLLLVIYFKTQKKNVYDNWDYSGYNYPEENPNAVVSGTPISGTVYVTEPKKNTGMGWIL